MAGSLLKRVVVRVFAVGISFAIGLVLVEVGLRLLPAKPSQARSTAIEQPTSTRFPRPDFRGRPPSEKAEGTFRLVVVGDSFSWGAGVYAEDAYPWRLERRLNELDSEVEFEVVSWSRPGWNTHQAFGTLKKSMRWLEADLLVLGFVLNDAEPLSMAKRETMQQVLKRRSPRSRFIALLHRHSRLYRLVWERLENTRQRRAFIDYYYSLYSGRSWDVCRSTLQRFRDSSRQYAVPMVLVIFPIFDTQLDGSYPYADLHGIVRRAAKDLEIPVLDLLRAYRGVDARRLAVTPFTNPHPSELAHRIAADRLVEYLLKKGLVPAQRVRPESARRPMAVQGDAVDQSEPQ